MVAYFIVMWVLEWAAIIFFRFGCAPGPVLGKARNRGERISPLEAMLLRIGFPFKYIFLQEYTRDVSLTFPRMISCSHLPTQLF
jgi:hypothetical protein